MVRCAQALDGVHHIPNVARGRNQVLGVLQAQLLTIFQEGLGVNRGVFLQSLLLRGGVLYNPVVDIGDVHYVVETETTGSQPFSEDVHKGEGTEVTVNATGEQPLTGTIIQLVGAEAQIKSLIQREPNLNEVFLNLTGKALRD